MAFTIPENLHPDLMPLDIVPVFILPPSINDLEDRLKKREEKNKQMA